MAAVSGITSSGSCAWWRSPPRNETTSRSSGRGWRLPQGHRPSGAPHHVGLPARLTPHRGRSGSRPNRSGFHRLRASSGRASGPTHASRSRRRAVGRKPQLITYDDLQLPLRRGLPGATRVAPQSSSGWCRCPRRLRPQGPRPRRPRVTVDLNGPWLRPWVKTIAHLHLVFLLGGNSAWPRVMILTRAVVKCGRGYAARA